MDIISYYLLLNSTALKLSHQKNKYVAIQNQVRSLYIYQTLFLIKAFVFILFNHMYAYTVHVQYHS